MKLKYDFVQDIYKCTDCRFCWQQFNGLMVPTVDLYCMIYKEDGKNQLKHIGTEQYGRIGWRLMDRPEWCPLKLVEEEEEAEAKLKELIQLTSRRFVN